MCFAPCSHLFWLFLLFPLFLLSVSSSKPNLWAQHRGPRGHVKKKRFSECLSSAHYPQCASLGSHAFHNGRTGRLGSPPSQALWSTRQAELAWTFPSAGAGQRKEHVRRKYSCSGALLPSVRWEHVRGGQTQKGSFRKRVWENRGDRGKLRMERKSFLYVHKCYLNICLAGTRASILEIWDCISGVFLMVPWESAAFHSSSIMCVFLPPSSVALQHPLTSSWAGCCP